MLSLNRWKSQVRVLYIQTRTLIQPRFQGSKWAGERGNPTSLNYMNELNSERNKVLWDVLNSFAADNFIEIGSSLGSKILGFAKDNPSINVVGLDINPQAVAKGKEIARDMQLSNVDFHVFDLTKANLSELKISISDAVIFSWATLIYIHPINIYKALKAVMHNRPKGFVFIEQHSADLGRFWKRGKIINRGPNYIRDYVHLLNKLLPSNSYEIEVRPIGSDVWGPGGGHAFMIIGRRNSESV